MLTKPLADFIEGRVDYMVLAHSRAYTAQGVAAALHVSGREFAKSVVVKTRDGRVLMAVVPGSRHLSLKALGALVGSEVELMPESEMVRLFPGSEAGAEPPFGNLYHVPVYADESLARDHEIVFNAGTHDEAVRMRYADWARLVEPTLAKLTGAN